MWQTKYALAEPKNLGLGLNFRLCSYGYFFRASVVLACPNVNIEIACI